LCLLFAVRKFEATSLSQLAGVLAVERTTLLRNARLLRRRGWIDTTKREGKRSRVVITSKGRRALARAIPKWERVQSRVGTLLGPSCRKLLGRILPSVIRAWHHP
jgi:DNA-binding MarR family transcriptional regulator